MYKATLIKGSTYDVLGCHFKLNAPQEVREEIFNYLEGNRQFDLTQTETEKAPGSNESHTKASIKKLSADEQRDLIVELGGNPDETNNEDERVTLILDLQEIEA